MGHQSKGMRTTADQEAKYQSACIITKSMIRRDIPVRQNKGRTIKEESLGV